MGAVWEGITPESANMSRRDQSCDRNLFVAKVSGVATPLNQGEWTPSDHFESNFTNQDRANGIR
jgi:hypothetical protein